MNVHDGLAITPSPAMHKRRTYTAATLLLAAALSMGANFAGVPVASVPAPDSYDTCSSIGGAVGLDRYDLQNRTSHRDASECWTLLAHHMAPAP